MIAESPEQDPHISKAELQYILDSLGKVHHNRKIKHPWNSMLLSLPVWAIIVSHFCENWGFYTLMTQLPTFMKGGFSACVFLLGVPAFYSLSC